ncbi:hypothetical protein GCM10009836_31160 [Pseudonocardia ailaonensis]|uniref:Uncharacterized protein n=1 Tax=Pseudonocardia ailaonensis TaxID=367279 RepID=A0ABN2N3W9_9PSEU
MSEQAHGIGDNAGSGDGAGDLADVRRFVPRQAPSPSDLAKVARLLPRQRVSPEGGPAGLSVAVGREPAEPQGHVVDRDRARILLRYARLMNSGRPVFCKPSRAELAGAAPRRQGIGGDGKVIYSDRESAEAAARELEELGARAQRAYVCKRSRHGHFHLTTDLATERRRALGIPASGVVIPQQQDRRSA